MKSREQQALEYMEKNINKPPNKVIDEVCEIWGYSRKTIYGLRNRLDIPGKKEEVEEVEKKYVPKYKGRAREKFKFDDSKLFK